MRIKKAFLRALPPFQTGEIAFPPKPAASEKAEVQLLTGQNGAGKTRLLSLLAAALGNNAELASRVGNVADLRCVVLAERERQWLFWATHHQNTGFVTGQAQQHLDLRRMSEGTFDIADAWTGSAMVAPSEGANGVRLTPTVAMAFRGSAEVSDSEVVALSPVVANKPEALLQFSHSKEEDKILGQSIVNIKMSAAMDRLDDTLQRETRAIKIASKLEETVSGITGRVFTFSVTPYPKVGLTIKWGKTGMKLRQLPDGLRSIVGWLAGCVAKLDALFPEHPDPLAIPFILLLDEPEGHLHPAWQRKLIPAAQSLFPNAQIFVATHSPFIISSVNEGWIHILRLNSECEVKCDEPIPCSEGDTFLDVIEDVLGIKEWYDPETEGLLRDFRRLKESILNSRQWDRVAELKTKAEAIAKRSESLRDLMGRELHQFERLKKQDVAKV